MFTSSRYTDTYPAVTPSLMWTTVFPEDNLAGVPTGNVASAATADLPVVWAPATGTTYKAKSALVLQAQGRNVHTEGSFVVQVTGVPPAPRAFNLDFTLLRAAGSVPTALTVTVDLPGIDANGILTVASYTGILEVPAERALPICRRVQWSAGAPIFQQNGDVPENTSTPDLQPMRITLATAGCEGNVFIPCIRLVFMDD
jgi:hypothetical protein